MPCNEVVELTKKRGSPRTSSFRHLLFPALQGPAQLKPHLLHKYPSWNAIYLPSLPQAPGMLITHTAYYS